MKKLEILTYPDERLKIPSVEVVDFGSDLREFVEELRYVMTNSPACVGIAAPQVDVHKRIILVDTSQSKHRENKVSHGFMVLINPRIVKFEGEIIVREGCLSVPDFTGNVKRYYWIEVEAFDLRGNRFVFDTEGFEAVVIQHEIDHLDGKLFIERVASPKDISKRKVYR
ncbi:peptide deformylase [Thermocrinis sp.]|uniref:peptide deformylase n=1 Tax=Thermocrinis sp. TaxID=2024383 RepID=UPI002FDDAE43